MTTKNVEKQLFPFDSYAQSKYDVIIAKVVRKSAKIYSNSNFFLVTSSWSMFPEKRFKFLKSRYSGRFEIKCTYLDPVTSQHVSSEILENHQNFV